MLEHALGELHSPLTQARGTHLNARMCALGDFLQPRLARLLDRG